jgi:hypothetical protein
MPVGSYPTLTSGHGWVAMVCTTLLLLVLMTDTVSLKVLATNSVPFAAYMAVGCKPTLMAPTGAFGSARLMTLTVPVVLAPVSRLAGTCVP